MGLGTSITSSIKRRTLFAMFTLDCGLLTLLHASLFPPFCLLCQAAVGYCEKCMKRAMS